MNRLAKVALGVLLGLGLIGVGGRGVWDYIAVGHAKLVKAANDRIPISAQIDRLQLVVGRLDEQLAKHQRVVAESSVELQQSERDVARLRESTDRERSKLVSLRELVSDDTCSFTARGREYSRGELETALRGKLDSYKSANRALDARESALARQRTSHDKLTRKLSDWKAERDTLAHTLTALRAEAESMRVSQSPAIVFDDSELQAARQLVERIEHKLDVEKAVREIQGDSGEWLDDLAVTPGKSDTPRDNSLAREVDELLSKPR